MVFAVLLFLFFYLPFSHSSFPFSFTSRFVMSLFHHVHFLIVPFLIVPFLIVSFLIVSFLIVPFLIVSFLIISFYYCLFSYPLLLLFLFFHIQVLQCGIFL